MDSTTLLNRARDAAHRPEEKNYVATIRALANRNDGQLSERQKFLLQRVIERNTTTTTKER